MACTGHSHDHEHAEEVTTHLREYINFPAVSCLNENIPSSGRGILKEYKNRTTPYPSVHSALDGDPELVLHVPFSEFVSITHISVRGPPPNRNDGSGVKSACPRSVKLFVNRDDVDFTTVEDLPPTMELELVHPDHEAEVAAGVAAAADGEEDGGGVTIDYNLRPAGRFSNLSSITLYFPDNFGTEEDDETQTEISYVGFKGKGMAVKRQAVEAVYEATGMPEDHKTPGNEYHNHFGV